MLCPNTWVICIFKNLSHVHVSCLFQHCCVIATLTTTIIGVCLSYRENSLKQQTQATAGGDSLALMLSETESVSSLFRHHLPILDKSMCHDSYWRALPWSLVRASVAWSLLKWLCLRSSDQLSHPKQPFHHQSMPERKKGQSFKPGVGPGVGWVRLQPGSFFYFDSFSYILLDPLLF